MHETSFGRRAAIFLGSLVLALYVLAPIAWLLSSSIQSEAEITSVPPHWIQHAPTLHNFEAIFSTDEQVTYETRRQGDTASGGFIPSTAGNLLPNVNPTFNWVRLAQRIPVRIALDRVPDGVRLVSGQTVTVEVHHRQDARVAAR